ncbi:MAG TPA: efflux RND transporter periplasmic adaptor subunit, partial [Solirubrobacteraceae bacterium]|nr:efflux RND transporter periplasmic adaptor subunit [Solirubrobacteraceae bacterium]
RVRVAAAGVAVLIAIALVLTSGGSGHRAGSGHLLTVTRGPIVATVGGVGHINAAGTASVLVSASTGGAAGGSPTGSSGGASSGKSASSGGASAGSPPGSSPASATGGRASTGAGGPASAPGDAVFPHTNGRVTAILVGVGNRVAAGQPIARLADDGTAQSNIAQTRNELRVARAELAQRRRSDPTRGPPPTVTELAAGRAAVNAAREKVRRVTRSPDPVEVNTARLDFQKAVAELNNLRNGSQSAIEAAQIAVDAGQQKLAQALAPAGPADITAAQLELAKAQIDLESLTTATTPPTPAALGVGRLAVQLAQQKLAQVTALPSPATVATARQELSKAQAELVAAQGANGPDRLAAAKQGVLAAKLKLAAARKPPAAVVSAARSDVGKAQADLSVIQARGGPSGATEQAIAGLKVALAQERVRSAEAAAGRLTVTAAAAGTVTNVLTAPGASVDPATPIVRAPDLGRLVVTMELSQFDVAKASVGNQAQVSIDALGGAAILGKVHDIAPVGVDNSGVVTYPVSVTLSRPAQRLRPGMTASVRIAVAARRDVVRLPLQAVGDLHGQPKVTVVTGSGTTERKVRLGLADAKYVEVLSGLRAGDSVMAAPQDGGASSQGP